MGVRASERDGWGRHPLRAMVEGGRTIAEEKYNHQKILRPLRYKTHQPEENGIVEQTLTRGGPSQAALSLEHQLMANDIIFCGLVGLLGRRIVVMVIMGIPT